MRRLAASLAAAALTAVGIVAAVGQPAAAHGAEVFPGSRQICSGGDRGPYDFSAFDAPRTGWPTTHLTAGG
ncbi:hypothetical protein [Isoptericola nanjingensis]|uniref:hypothetical protein n=1 Tax=Isoptericola TaxID=254250 RepID=UPI003D2477F2|nr:hypothetical protein [Isoptericola sp. QY 916]